MMTLVCTTTPALLFAVTSSAGSPASVKCLVFVTCAPAGEGTQRVVRVRPCGGLGREHQDLDTERRAVESREVDVAGDILPGHVERHPAALRQLRVVGGEAVRREVVGGPRRGV